MRIFRSDRSLMERLSRVVDLVTLNLITLVCCLPVITIGAAMTGMHYVLYKMAGNEEGYIVRAYFKSFKENFLQATAMWLLFLLFGCVFALDISLTGGMSSAGGNGLQNSVQLPAVFRYLLVAGGIYIYLVFLYAFPLLARFRNSIFGTLKNAASLVVAAFPRTLGMAIATIVLPLAVSFFAPIAPILLLVGLSGPGLIGALLYRPVFEKIENHSGNS